MFAGVTDTHFEELELCYPEKNSLEAKVQIEMA